MAGLVGGLCCLRGLQGCCRGALLSPATLPATGGMDGLDTLNTPSGVLSMHEEG